MVIVLLGILSAFAIPRFADLRSNAEVAVLTNLSGTLRTAAEIVHAKALVENLANGSQTVDLGDGVPIETYDGYPVGLWYSSSRYLINLDDADFVAVGTVCESEWCGNGGTSTPTGAPTVLPGGSRSIFWTQGSDGNLCYAYYIHQQDGTKPLTGVVSDGC